MVSYQRMIKAVRIFVALCLLWMSEVFWKKEIPFLTRPAHKSLLSNISKSLYELCLTLTLSSQHLSPLVRHTRAPRLETKL